MNGDNDYLVVKKKRFSCEANFLVYKKGFY